MEVNAQIKVKSKIDYNKEEIEKSLTALEERYTGLTFTDEQVKEAKEERAKLNKLAKALGDSRKDIIAEATAEIKPFENFMKSAEKRAKALSDDIGNQIKAFEEEQKIIRLGKVVDYIEEVIKENPQYNDYREELQPSPTEAIFTNKGSFTTKGEVGQKILDHYSQLFSTIDERIEARLAEEKLREDKKTLIHKTCVDMTELLNLEIELNPCNYYHLIDSELSEISEFIKNSAKAQQEKEQAAVERIRKQEEEKARIEAQRKAVEAKKALQEDKKDDVLYEKKVEEKIDKQKSQKLFYGALEFEGITIEEAKRFKKFLDENKIAYKVQYQEVK